MDNDDSDKASSNAKKPLLKVLSEIEISAPADFSENIDAYLTGEKCVTNDEIRTSHEQR